MQARFIAAAASGDTFLCTHIHTHIRTYTYIYRHTGILVRSQKGATTKRSHRQPHQGRKKIQMPPHMHTHVCIQMHIMDGCPLIHESSPPPLQLSGDRASVTVDTEIGFNKLRSESCIHVVAIPVGASLTLPVGALTIPVGAYLHSTFIPLRWDTTVPAPEPVRTAQKSPVPACTESRV
eukprot:GHVU01160061.1.p1 GENE.GHVU01160061.1~~GHVU01160061.1.p1  ORF type:complete len:179 (-),score=8.91 GHVU01160061.1:138-674(-)